MGKKNDLEQEPLLYITQPQVQKARVSMQQSFIIKADKRGKNQERTEDENSNSSRVQEPPKEDDKQYIVKSTVIEKSTLIEKVEESQTKEEVAELAPPVIDSDVEESVRKSFKDLDNKQKIYYLLNRPHYIPEVLCQLKTQSGLYIGYVKSFEDEMVTLRAYNQLSIIKIPYSDIITIQMRMI
ncbi:CotO family spore coat protein [Ectobacillus polymachus]|uniref:CotO family spore coat protein n=1 Tax=Ectobacillus polymachus TaxID=1508806 RepID=UPI003A8517AF